MRGKRIYYIILVFFAVQIAAVNFSIALSSLAFGIWGVLWLVYTIFIERGFDKETLGETKLLIGFIGLFITADFVSRIAGGFNEHSHEGLKRHLLFFIMFFIIFTVRSREDILRVVYTFIIVTAVISVYEIVVYFATLSELLTKLKWVEIRIDYFSNPLTQGQIKMGALVFMIPFLFMKEPPVKRLYIVLVYIPIFLSMFLTQSRNVYLAFAASVIIYGMIRNRRIVVAFVLILIIFLFAAPEKYTSRITSIADPEQETNKIRITMWEQSWKIFKDYPVFGTGERFATFEELYTQYEPIEDEKSGEGTHLHNNLLMIQATNGIIGLIPFIGLFLIIFLKQIRFYKAEKDNLSKMIILGAILVFISFHLAGMFDYNFRDQKIMPVVLFLITIPFAINRFKK
jgi:putative inorganic carbon (hco3(-)) transporter